MRIKSDIKYFTNVAITVSEVISRSGKGYIVFRAKVALT